jgi:O-antigen/teichoic acid export membrane protein
MFDLAARRHGLSIDKSFPRMQIESQESAGPRGVEDSIQRLGRDSLIYGVGGMAAKAVGFLLLPVYTRIFVPAEYGVIELLTVMSSFVGVFLVLGTDSAQSFYFFEQKKGGRVAQAGVVSAIVQWRILWGAAVVIVSTLFSPLLSQICFGGRLSWEYFAISFVGALFAQMMTQCAEVFRLLYRPWAYIGVTLGSTLACAAIAITLVVVFHGGVLGYLVGFAAGSALAAVIGWVRIRHYLNLSRWHFEWWPKLIRFGLPLMPSGLVLLVMTTADRWFMNTYHSPQALGVYAIGAKFSLLIAMLTENFRKAWWPIGLDAMHKEEGPELFRVVSRLYLGLGMAGVVLLTACSPWLVKWFAAPDYREAYPVVGVLGFSSIFYGFFLISGAGSWKSEQTIWTTLALGIGALINLALCALWVPRFAGLGAAVAASLAMFVSNVILMARGEQLWRVRFPAVVLLAQIALAAVTSAAILRCYMENRPAGMAWVMAAVAVAILVWSALRGRGAALLKMMERGK